MDAVDAAAALWVRLDAVDAELGSPLSTYYHVRAEYRGTPLARGLV